MQLSKSVTLVQLLAAVSAITITSPARDSSARPVAYNNGTFTVTWTTVSTDPTQINIQLSTNNGQSTSTIAQNVASSANQYAVDLTGLAPGSNYAVNLASASNSGSTGILAQSGTFTVEQGEVAVTSTTVATTSTAASTVASGSVVASSARSEVSASAAVPVATGSAVGASVSGSAVILPVATASGSSAASGFISAVTSGASASGSVARQSGSSGTGASSPSPSAGSGSQTAGAEKTVGSLAFLGLGAIFGLML